MERTFSLFNFFVSSDYLRWKVAVGAHSSLFDKERADLKLPRHGEAGGSG